MTYGPDRSAVEQTFGCSSSTADSVLGELRVAYEQGVAWQPIYPYLTPHTVEALECALRSDDRFDLLDRRLLAAMMLDAWESGQTD